MTDSKKVNVVLPPILFESFQEFLSMYQSLYSKSSTMKKRSPLMIVGAPGVGKTLFSEVFVEYYKKEYSVPDSKIKRINIAAIPKDLIESSLFGYKKGAFTGAVNNYAGLVGELEEGIIVFDEIGELSKEVQAKLLTFIEDGYYYSLGDDKKKESKGLQIVATTNRTFEDRCFRQDFFDRFYPFYMLPLYKRREDILYYWAYLFPELTKKLTMTEILTILTHNWPGNVREIERVGQQIIASMDYLNKYAGGATCNRPLSTMLPEYSEMSILHALPIWEELQNSDVDHKFLESVMNRYGLGLSYEQNKKPLAAYKFHLVKYEDHSSSKFNIEYFKAIKQFDLAFEGLTHYCNLFRQHIHGDKNLLDLTKGYYDPILEEIHSYTFEKEKDKKKLKKHLELIMDLNKFALLKAGIDKKPEPVKDDNTGDETLDILSMTQENLLKMYYKGLIDASDGNKAEAAKKAGLNYRTFLSSLRKYDI
jgi:DNA-binding NtrC family response regulator